MEKRVNIAELLKNCPTGMELDCAMYDNVKLDYVEKGNAFPIKVQTPEGQISLNKYGCRLYNKHAKCVIFPKGKTTWEGFQRPFKDGDIVCTAFGSIVILKSTNEYSSSYCGLFHDVFCTDIIAYPMRLATEEEKRKLFDAIKANGYKWDEETKTLEELVELKEDTDDRVILSGICFDRENYADEVELHLGNYEIEIRDGKTYAVFKSKTKTLEKIEQTPDWSEEDEKILDIITSVLRVNFEPTERFIGCEDYMNVDLINWLKSLKYRYTWKPSDRQIEQLGWIAEQNKNNMIGKELMTLYNDLKKLKE